MCIRDRNTTREQMKMFLTRLGFNSKMVITGDITQIDLPNGAKSGLKDCIKIPVSYTHLDVYKRQTLSSSLMNFILSLVQVPQRAVRTPQISLNLSLIHILDVYKRQSLHQSRKNACLPLWKRTRFTASIMMRLCFCWKRDFVFLNFAD